MKSEALHFSPTSAGVRIDHINLHQSSKNTSDNRNNKNHCGIANHTNNCNVANFSLPRARVLASPATSKSTSQDEDDHRQFLDLEQIVIRNHQAETAIITDKNSFTPRCRQKPSNKMRNCLVLTGIAVVLGLLSFVFLVECRSLKGTSHSKKHYDTEISSESRIQDDSLQEPDPESSEEYPTKVVSTTFTSKDATSSSSTSPVSSSTKSSSTTTKRTSGNSPTSSGRLTRSRVSVICKGGYAGVLEEDIGKTSTSPSSTGKSYSRKHDVDLPTILPRESDDDEDDDEGGERNDWEDENEGEFNSEESKHQVITVTGYSQVAGRKPEIKALKKSGSTNSITYLPKPSRKVTPPNEDDNESSSSEEVEVTTGNPKPKATSHHKSKAQKVSHKASTEAPAPHKSSSSDKKNKHRQRKRESSEEDVEEDEAVTTTPRSSKQSSKHSSKKSKRPSPSHPVVDENEKGDSGEIEEDSLFPTFRSSKSENKGDRKRKASERRQKDAAVIPLEGNPDLESAEAEPEAATLPPSKNRSSSRSKKSKSAPNSDNRKSASSTKSVTVARDISSEEYKMEEMPFAGTSHGSKKSKSRSSSSITSSSSRSSRMSSRTVAPKQRTGTFSSIEED